MWPFLPSQEFAWIPSYYLFSSLAFTIGIFWIVKRAKKSGESINQAIDLCLWMMVGIFFGGRLFHLLFEERSYFFSHPAIFFKFWIGGFVFYGGFLGALLTVFIYKKFRPFDFFKMADLMAPIFAFGYGLGRIGCFFAGCCYGKPTTMPWGVAFPPWSEAVPYKFLHPTQLYSTIWEWTVLAVILFLEKKSLKTKPGFIFGVWLTLHGLGRALIEQFRDDFRGQTVFKLSISTWISLMVIASGIYLIKQKRSRSV